MNAGRRAGYTFAVPLQVAVPMLHTLRLLLLVSFIAAALAACGNKGPLVLPDKTPEQQDKDSKKKEPPAGPAQPAAQTPTDSTANRH